MTARSVKGIGSERERESVQQEVNVADRAKRVGHSVDKKKSKAAPMPAPVGEEVATPERVDAPAPATRDVVDMLPAHLLSPEELYRRERARRGAPAASTALAEARQAYLDLLKAEAASGKGGRPRSKPAAAKVASDDDVDLGSTAEHEVVLEAHDDVHDDVEHEDVHVEAEPHDEDHDEPAPPARRAATPKAAPKPKAGARSAPPAKRAGKPGAHKASAPRASAHKAAVHRTGTHKAAPKAAPHKTGTHKAAVKKAPAKKGAKRR